MMLPASASNHPSTTTPWGPWAIPSSTKDISRTHRGTYVPCPAHVESAGACKVSRPSSPIECSANRLNARHSLRKGLGSPEYVLRLMKVRTGVDTCTHLSSASAIPFPLPSSASCPDRPDLDCRRERHAISASSCSWGYIRLSRATQAMPTYLSPAYCRVWSSDTAVSRFQTSHTRMSPLLLRYWTESRRQDNTYHTLRAMVNISDRSVLWCNCRLTSSATKTLHANRFLPLVMTSPLPSRWKGLAP